ncbi:MAG: GNAT family N-acetyltransferase [Candidatus Binataceae bacterium]
MTIEVRPFCTDSLAGWDDLITRSVSGTFLHSRRFLSYHGDRFHDLSVCIYDGGHLMAVFPAAVDPAEEACATSHPGATYGGLMHDGGLWGNRMIEALEKLREYYARLGLRRLRYKAVPRMYHRVPAEDDLYALFRAGARRYRCDLASVVDLGNRLTPSKRRKRCVKAALASNVLVQEGSERLADFWELLEGNLACRHKVRPVHTIEEMRALLGRFPDQIRLVTAIAAEQMVAGVLLFVMPTAVHTQYISASEAGYALHALDAVIEHCIAAASLGSVRWFSMGISNEENGSVLNDGLHQFKSEFGAGAMAHEFYEIDLA